MAAAELMDDAAEPDTNEIRSRLLSGAGGWWRRRRTTPRAIAIARCKPLEDELERSAPGPARAEVLWSIGKIKFEGEGARVGLDYFRRALAESGDDTPARVGSCTASPFPWPSRRGFPRRGSTRARRSRSPSALGDKPTLARALAHLGFLAFMCDEGLDSELFERAVALEEESGGLKLDYGPTARYARVLYDAGLFDQARPLLEQLCERGRESGDAAVNMPLHLLASIEYQTGKPGTGDDARRRSTRPRRADRARGRRAARPVHARSDRGRARGVRARA